MVIFFPWGYAWDSSLATSWREKGIMMTQDEAKALVSSVATDLGYDVGLALAQCDQESKFNPNAVSPAGAYGLFQLMPETAIDLQVNQKDPEQNVRGGIRYMQRLLMKYGASLCAALAAYNWGPGNVDKVIANHLSNWPWYCPNETQHYVYAVLRNAERYSHPVMDEEIAM